jgi:hypothetical protein
MKRALSLPRSKSVSSNSDTKDTESTEAGYAAASASDRSAASDRVTNARKKKPKISVTALATEKSGDRLKTHDRSPGSPLRASVNDKSFDGANSTWQRPVSPLRTSAPTFLVGKDLTAAASTSDQAPADQPGETTSPREDWIARHGQPSFIFDECPIEFINELAAGPASPAALPAGPASPTRGILAAVAMPGKTENEKRLAAVASQIQVMMEKEAAIILKALIPRPADSPAEAQKLDSARSAFARFMHQFNKAKLEAQNNKGQETASALAEAGTVLKSFVEKDYKTIADLIPRDEKCGAGKKEIGKCLRQIESACSKWAEPASGNRNRSVSSPVSPGRHRTEPGKLQKRPMSVQLPGRDKTPPWGLDTQGLEAQPGSPQATGRERNSAPYAPLTGSAGTGVPLARASSTLASGSSLSTETKRAHTSDTQGATGTARTAQGSNQTSANDADKASIIQELNELDSLVDQWLG